MSIVHTYGCAAMPIEIKTTVNQTLSQWNNAFCEHTLAGQSQTVPLDL